MNSCWQRGAASERRVGGTADCHDEAALEGAACTHDCKPVGPVSAALGELQIATMKQHCKALRVPTIANQFVPMAEQAIREKKTHVGYLEALLAAEVEDRERNTIERRIKEARLPRVKTLEEFDFSQSPHVT